MVATSTRARRFSSFLLVAALAALLAKQLAACETPVFRYAMYRWSPTPYEIYFFHDKPAGESADVVAKLITEASEKTKNRANVVHLSVDVAADPTLNSVPPDVKKAWEQRQDKSLPAYLVSTPYGIEIFSGGLDEKAVKGLLDSPARLELAKQLEAGKIGVFVMLEGKQAEENKRVAGVLQALSKEVAAGQISLYISPSQQSTAEGDSGSESESESQHELGLIRVKRDAANEQWFVRTLVAMEPDLKEETRPMVFLVYGRARALLPYIGEGITRENLIREVEFISGACSCTVKEQNPGVDLLVRYDWDAAAASVADKFGSEEGNESQFGVDMFFPDLVIPSEDASTEIAAANSEEESANQQDPTLPDSTLADAGDGSGGELSEQHSGDQQNTVQQSTSIAANETAASSEPELTGVDNAVASANTTYGETASSLSVAPPSSGYSSILIVGAGLAVAMVVLFGLTFLVMRPQ